MKPLFNRTKSIAFCVVEDTVPHKGTETIVSTLNRIAETTNSDSVVFVRSEQDITDLYHEAFGNVRVVQIGEETTEELCQSLDDYYSSIYLICGKEEVLAAKNTLDEANGHLFHFDSIYTVPCVIQDYNLKSLAESNNFLKFRECLPRTLKNSSAIRLYEGLKTTNEEETLREEYIKGELFNIGDVVKHKNTEMAITYCGPNYVVLEGELKVWIHEIEPTGQIDESVVTSQKDKLKAARIIGMTLGYDKYDKLTDPTAIINNSLKSKKSELNDKDTRASVARMLQLASKMGVKYDYSLFEDVAAADYKLDKTGKKHHRVIKIKGSTRKDTDDYADGEGIYAESAHTDEEEKEQHNLMANKKPSMSRYERIRKIQMKLHEKAAEEEEEDLDPDDIADSISDDEIIEYGYDDDEFEVVDEETGEFIEDFELAPLNEILSRVERMRAKVKMKKSKAKRQRGARIALKRRSTSGVVAKRARRLATKALKQRLAKKPLSQMTTAEKERVEKRMEKLKPIVTRIALKMVKRVRELERSRLQ